ncbi:hypothetical protein VTO73DRAFT_13910 [Trametes versicolor]
MAVTFLEPLTPADFIHVETDSTHTEERQPTTCKQILAHLHTEMTESLQKAAGDLSAELRYSERRYAEDIVILRRLKLAGWPANVPYVCFSHIRGGILVACELLKDWNEGKISFTPATPEDIANAKRDPATVHPNYRRPANTGKQASSATQEPVVVPSLVLRSDTMDDVGVQLTSTQPSTAAAPPRQRSDVKKPRHRDLTSTYCRPNPLPKEGVKSEPYILESASEALHQVPLSESSSGHGCDWPVQDPLPEFLPAAAWWGALTYFGTPPSVSYGDAEETSSGSAMDVLGTAVGEGSMGIFGHLV